MAILSYHVPDPSPNFNRARVKGFIGSTNTSHLTISDGALDIYYLYPRYHFHLVLYDNFYQPNSNMYSCDRAFLLDGSYLIRDGVNIDAIVWLAFKFIPEDGFYRILVLADEPYNPAITVDLPPLPGYWAPIVPL